jgi:hypothetical protein
MRFRRLVENEYAAEVHVQRSLNQQATLGNLKPGTQVESLRQKAFIGCNAPNYLTFVQSVRQSY